MASMEQRERIDPMEESFHEDAKLCLVCGKNFKTVSGNGPVLNASQHFQNFLRKGSCNK